MSGAALQVQEAVEEIAAPLDMAGALLRTEGPRILGAFLVFLFVVLLGALVAAGVGRLLARTGRAGRYSRVVRRLIRWVMAVLGAVLALHVVGLTAIATSVLATGGIMAVILGFAFKDIGENLLAGIFLAFSRSFDVGDLIESGGLRGVVRSIDLRDTHIRTADGCDIFIPSAAIFRNPLLNFTRDGLRRGTFTVGIDYRDDAAAAVALLQELITAVDGILETPPPLVELSGFAPGHVEIAVHFWVDTFSGAPFPLAAGRTAAMDSVRRALLEHGYTVSSEVTTALAVPPLQVSVDGGSRAQVAPPGKPASGAAPPGTAASGDARPATPGPE